MRYFTLGLDLAAGALTVAGAWLLAPWLGLIVAGVFCFLLSLTLDPPKRRP